MNKNFNEYVVFRAFFDTSLIVKSKPHFKAQVTLSITVRASREEYPCGLHNALLYCLLLNSYLAADGKILNPVGKTEQNGTIQMLLSKAQVQTT